MESVGQIGRDRLHDAALALAVGIILQSGYQKFGGLAVHHRDELAGGAASLVAVAARAGFDANGVSPAAAMSRPVAASGSTDQRKVAIGRGVEIGQPLEEGDQRPDFVVALLRHPGGHAGVFDAVLDDPEQLAVVPFLAVCVRSGGGGSACSRCRVGCCPGAP